MEQEFYKGRLRDRHGLDAIVPDEAGRELVHGIIYEELCRGVVRRIEGGVPARDRPLRHDGADGIILGCTELTMLIGQDDLDLPVFDTTRIHAEAAMDFAMAARPDPAAGFVERLVAGALAGRRDDVLFGSFCDELLTAGLPLLRAALGAEFLHPAYDVRQLRWMRDRARTTIPPRASQTARLKARIG